MHATPGTSGCHGTKSALAMIRYTGKQFFLHALSLTETTIVQCILIGPSITVILCDGCTTHGKAGLHKLYGEFPALPATRSHARSETCI